MKKEARYALILVCLCYVNCKWDRPCAASVNCQNTLFKIKIWHMMHYYSLNSSALPVCRVSQLHQIPHGASSGSQQQTCQVWCRSDQLFSMQARWQIIKCCQPQQKACPHLQGWEGVELNLRDGTEWFLQSGERQNWQNEHQTTTYINTYFCISKYYVTALQLVK